MPTGIEMCRPAYLYTASKHLRWYNSSYLRVHTTVDPSFVAAEDTVTKAMLAQTGKEEEDSDVPEDRFGNLYAPVQPRHQESKTPIFPVLDSPKRSVCGGLGTTRFNLAMVAYERYTSTGKLRVGHACLA